MQLKIDPEFKSLIPPLSDDERTELRASLQSEGCRDALVVWDKTIIDGHNRYELCQELAIPFKTVQRAFDDRNAAMLWMIDNQLARRNLPAFARAELELRRKPLLANDAQKRLSSRQRPDQNSDQAVSTLDNIGEKVGVSRDTIHKVETVLNDAPDAIKVKARSGDMSTHRAYKMTQALMDAEPDIIEVVVQHNIDEPDTVEDLKRLKKSSEKPNSNGTWDEIVRSGYIQPGDESEAVHISDSPSRIRQALGIKSGTHAILANHQLINQSESPEWYTPSLYVEAGRRVMGGFDIDPASCEQANQTVQATTYYTKETNGLDKDWEGRCWINPPYGGLAPKFIARLEDQYQAGSVTEAIAVLSGNSLMTVWFAPLWKYMICFPSRRINFENPGGIAASATHGTVFVYLGQQERRFYDEFKEFGCIMKQVHYR